MIFNIADAPFKATIKVTYPSGTCTCALGDRVFTHSGGGTATFEVNKKGDWTVAATNTDAISEKTVSITDRNQVASITLQYVRYMYDGANNVSSVSGGWEKFSGTGTLTINSASMTLDVPSKSYGANTAYIRAKKKVDLTAYSKAEATYANLVRVYGRGSFCIFDNSGNIVASTDFDDSKTKISINVKTLKGQYYVGFYLNSYYDGSGWNSASADIKQVKLLS